jgi:hypothetical protein
MSDTKVLVDLLRSINGSTTVYGWSMTSETEWWLRRSVESLPEWAQTSAWSIPGLAANAIERLTAERDEARRLVIEADWCKDPAAKWPDLWAARGWPVPASETTTLTCPYCDYREVVHAKPSPSDHAMCAFCAMEHSE